MIHIWHEDSAQSATTQFWIFLKVNNVHTAMNNSDIRGFGSNSNLLKYIKIHSFNPQDTYHIFVDKVIDNQKALKYYIDIKQEVKAYKNVVVHNLLSFEYMMLRFKNFIEWTEPTGNNQLYSISKPVRKQFIDCIDNQIPWVRQKDIVAFVVKRFNINTNMNSWQRELQFISSENVATSLLSAMTNGGTVDFGISKTRFGECWHCNCCSKYKAYKIGNKKCRIYKYHKKALEKARNLWNNTYAKNIAKHQIS